MMKFISPEGQNGSLLQQARDIFESLSESSRENCFYLMNDYGKYADPATQKQWQFFFTGFASGQAGFERTLAGHVYVKSSEYRDLVKKAEQFDLHQSHRTKQRFVFEVYDDNVWINGALQKAMK